MNDFMGGGKQFYNPNLGNPQDVEFPSDTSITENAL